MSIPVGGSTGEVFTKFVGELSVAQIVLLCLWVVSRVLHRFAELVADFLERHFLSALEGDQFPGRWKEPACPTSATDVPEISPVGLCKSLIPGSYLLPSDQIVVDDDLPVLCRSGETRFRANQGSSTGFRR